MSTDERELRDALEDAQQRVREAEKKARELTHELMLSQTRETELKAEAEGLRLKLASLSDREPQEMAALVEQLRLRLAEVERALDAAFKNVPRRPASGGVCPRCGSLDFAQRATLRGPNGHETVVAVDGAPNAAFFRETVTSRLFAACCARCGLVELGAEQPARLADAWQKSHST